MHFWCAGSFELCKSTFSILNVIFYLICYRICLVCKFQISLLLGNATSCLIGNYILLLLLGNEILLLLGNELCFLFLCNSSFLCNSCGHCFLANTLCLHYFVKLMCLGRAKGTSNWFYLQQSSSRTTFLRGRNLQV